MRYVVVIHYPECDIKDEAAVFTTAATRSELLNALKCVKEVSCKKHFYYRFERAYWVCKKAAGLVDGKCVLTDDDCITVDIEEPEEHK